MEKVEIVATSHFTDFKLGSVTRKTRMFTDAATAERLRDLGVVRFVDPQPTAAKMPEQTEPRVAGGGEPSASLQAAQASPPTIVNSPAVPDGLESPSTTPGASLEIPTFFTPATKNGGPETTRLTLRAKGGRKT